LVETLVEPDAFGDAEALIHGEDFSVVEDEVGEQQ